MRISLLVEGHGDVAAMPTLVGKIGATVGLPLYSIRPIRTGGWPHLKRAGELERFLELALSHQPDRVLAVLDLEDHCPAEENAIFEARAKAVLGLRTTPVEAAFSIREYETWFLFMAAALNGRVGNGQWDLRLIPDQPEGVRGAKEALSRIMKVRYKETIHQARLTAALDIAPLYARSRSFRRMVSAVTGSPYEDLVQLGV